VKLVIRAVGKMRDRRMEELSREYLERVRRHLPVEVAEVETDEKLCAQLPAGAEIIALEPGGDSWTTDQLMRFDRLVTGGRQGLYKYVDMDIASEMGITMAEHLLSGRSKREAIGDVPYEERLFA